LTPPRRLRDVLGARVLVDGVCVGHVTGVLVDEAHAEAIGLEVTSREDARRRFLPWVAATLIGRELVSPSSLLVVDSCDPYLRRGASICRDPVRLDAFDDAFRLARVGV
jgi:hypothetical protein